MLTLDRGSPLAIVQNGQLAKGFASSKSSKDFAILDHLIFSLRRNVEVRSGISLPDDIASGGHPLELHTLDDLPDLAGAEVLQEVVLGEGLLDELLGPEVLVHLVHLEGLGGVDALAGDALLLVDVQLAGHCVVLLDRAQESLVSLHHARRLLEDALENVNNNVNKGYSLVKPYL